ncbi:MAG: S-layer homology domain-containing protein, partial [Anaerovorax sp.]|nr:S-layer homology domain-containing protein [Anaerovorax sp.]
ADDTAVAPYAKDAVILMQKGGIISGIKQEDGSYKFAPKANATRAEAVTMIFKYLKK